MLNAGGDITTTNLNSQDGRIRLLSDGDTSTVSLSAEGTIFALSGGDFVSGNITDFDGTLRIIATDTVSIDQFNSPSEGGVNILSRTGDLIIRNNSSVEDGDILLRALNGNVTAQQLRAQAANITAGGFINTGNLVGFRGEIQTNSGGNTTIGTSDSSGISAISGGTFTADSFSRDPDTTIRAAGTVNLVNLGESGAGDVNVISTGGNIIVSGPDTSDVGTINLTADTGNVTINNANVSSNNIRITAPNGDITAPGNLTVFGFGSDNLILTSGGAIDVGNLTASQLIRVISDGAFDADNVFAPRAVVNGVVLPPPPAD